MNRRGVDVKIVKGEGDSLKKKKDPVVFPNGEEAGSEGFPKGPGGGQGSGLEGCAATAGLFCLGIDDPESGVGQFLLIIQCAICQKGNTVCGDKEAGSVLFNHFIGWLGDPDVHAIRKPGTSALFNKQAQPPGGIIGWADLLDSAGGFIGQLNHNESLRKSKRLSKKGHGFWIVRFKVKR